MGLHCTQVETRSRVQGVTSQCLNNVDFLSPTVWTSVTSDLSMKPSGQGLGIDHLITPDYLFRMKRLFRQQWGAGDLFFLGTPM